MLPRFAVAAFPFAIALALAGCGGGGGGALSPAGGGGNASQAPQQVQLNMHIPGSSSASTARRNAQFVAASTEGVLVVVYATSDTQHQTPLGTSATNVSPGSAACGGASGARTCTVTIPAPPGQDDFVFTTYDQPPNGPTTFPANANVLAKGIVTNKTIQVAVANVVNVTLSGALATTQANPFQYSLVAGVGPGTYTLEFTAYDAGGNVIIGPYVDGNGNPNPITVTVQESGGSGYTTIEVDGGAAGSSGVVNSSSDYVTVDYTGGGAVGYYATLHAVSASGASLSPTFDPAFISSTSPAWTGGSNAQINLTTPGESATINLNEANYTATFGVNQNSCANVVTITNPAPSGPSESFTVSGSAGGSCTATIYDGRIAYNVNITAVSSTTATIAVPGTTLAYVADGPSGVAIRTSSGQKVGSIATASSADDLALDDAGNAYVATAPNQTAMTPASIALYRPSGSGYPPAYANANVSYTLTDPQHLFYLSASGAGELVAMEFNPASMTQASTFDIWDPGVTGAPSRTIVIPAASSGSQLIFGALAHNGNLYTAGYVPCGVNTCVQYSVFPPGSATPSRTFMESYVPQANQSGFTPNYGTVGPDGTLYVTEWTFVAGDPNAGLYIYPPSGPERYYSLGAYTPDGIDLDGNGNIYVVDDNSSVGPPSYTTFSNDTAHYLAELSPDGGTQIRSTNIAPGSVAVTVAADGTAYVSSFFGLAPNGVAGTYVVSPSNAVTQIDTYGAYNVILYNGSNSTAPQSTKRGTLSVGPGGSAHSGGVSWRRRH